MPDLRTHRDGSLRSARNAWLLALVVATASAAISAAAYSGDPARPTAAGAAPAHARPSVSGAAALPSTGADTAVGTGRVTTVPGAPAHSSTRPTMSMDDPIQGGLSAHQEQVLSARLLSKHQDAKVAPKTTYWTPALGRTAAARAQSWLGMPYSWAGGNGAGPTPGRCDLGTGGDLDCHVVGFDCSGLAMYAWGKYAALPHLAETQREAGGFHPTVKQLLPGDLVFFSAYLPSGTGHVGIYTGDGTVIEAPQSGSVVRRSTLSHMMATDGTYRGAVRPLTTETPKLAAPHAAVPRTGGTVTLRGAHLAGVDALHLGDTTVRTFVRHSDSTIVFRAPRHRPGAVPITVSTSWKVTSRPVALTYAAPRPKTPATTPPPSTTSPPKSTPTPTPTTTPPSTPPSTTKPPTTPPPSTTSPPKSTSTPTTSPTTSGQRASKGATTSSQQLGTSDADATVPGADS